MRKVFVIGNGFDLDLGLKTRYIDFWNSDFMKKYKEGCYNGLIYYLNGKAQNESTWFDIENLIRIYTQNTEHGLQRIRRQEEVDLDRTQFNTIRYCLAEYLEKEVSVCELKRDSLSSKVLGTVIDDGDFSIYNFNYTNLHTIASKLGINRNFSYNSVHGKAGDKSLILGIDDKTEVQKGYDFVHKTFSPYYHSVPLKFDLEDAKEIVIFGLSMGDIDYPYFQDFFYNICNPRNRREQSKRITIFTYDETSRIDILRQLRTMNEKRVNYMFGQNDLTLIRTSVDEDKTKLYEFIKKLDDTSKKMMRMLNGGVV